jgi:hypothetical protein
MVGGALGVAVLGSVLSHGYRDGVEDALTGLPPDAATTADSSVGGAASVADRLGPAGDALRNAADAAFVTGMADAAVVAASVVLAGAVIAAVWLPARAKSAEPVADAPGAQPAGA